MAHIPLDEELADTIMSAHHKAATLVGLLKSPKRSPQKAATIKGLVKALDDDIGTLACEVFEAYDQERRNGHHV
jgi:hypothetical protein